MNNDMNIEELYEFFILTINQIITITLIAIPFTLFIHECDTDFHEVYLNIKRKVLEKVRQNTLYDTYFNLN